MTGSTSHPIDIQVDLRKFWSSVRDQGARSACLACATSDAHMYCHDLRHPLSAEFLFYHSGQFMPGQDVSAGLTFSAVERALRLEGQPDEEEWPYEPMQPALWVPPSVTQRWYASTNSPHGAVEQILTAMQTRQPVVLGVQLTQDFFDLPAPHIISPDGAGFGGHAVLAVGWSTHNGAEPLLLIRNSWGATWADEGYAWLPTAYLKDKLIGYRILEPFKQ